MENKIKEYAKKCDEALEKINVIMWESYCIKDRTFDRKDGVKIMEVLNEWASISFPIEEDKGKQETIEQRLDNLWEWKNSDCEELASMSAKGKFTIDFSQIDNLVNKLENCVKEIEQLKRIIKEK